ncbi:hypothetical protein DL764_004896 [Monosporascus ibericus]|uniref:Uncharacterized protein n=1 Tax=Monosporascus ibericus TaxID=155417 RepID=A0A4Q4TDP7_9PEZI|nr:hypothetical protein DL764_004896 [Monosporascus ibericus]
MMPYDYPQASRDGADAGMHAEYMSGYHQPTASSVEGTNDADLGSIGLSGEKKRNKLGYHRSALACGRLRKDCTYRPVDHPAPGIPGQTGGLSAPHMEEPAASPSVISGRPLQTRGAQHHEQMATGQDLGQASAGPEGDNAYSANQRMSSSVPGYGHGIANWAASQTATVTSPSSGGMHGGMGSDSAWRHYPHESPVTPGLPPFAAHQPQTSSGWPPAPVGAPTVNEPTPRSEDGWSSFPQPMRSLSYGGEATGQYLPDRLPYDRRASTTSDMYPPLITTNTAAMAGSAMDPRAPLSAGAVPPATYATWPDPYQYTESGDEYGDWYGETGGEPSYGGDMYYQGR